ncbi:hypothetical protein D3C71_2119200 [compost metagenome]
MAFTLFDGFLAVLKVPLKYAWVPEEGGVQRVLRKRVVIDAQAVKQALLVTSLGRLDEMRPVR